MKIGKLRKKLQDSDWVNREYRKWCNEKSGWEQYWDFECSEFFKGEELAELNRKRYHRNMRVVQRHIDFLKQFLKD